MGFAGEPSYVAVQSAAPAAPSRGGHWFRGHLLRSLDLERLAGLVVGLSIFSLLVRRSGAGKAVASALVLYLIGGVAGAGLTLLGTSWPRKFPVLEPLTTDLQPRLEAAVGPEGRFHPNVVAGWLL